MKDETRTWLSYADENLDVAGLSFSHGHLNACLQNTQQAVEKCVKNRVQRARLWLTPEGSRIHRSAVTGVLE